MTIIARGSKQVSELERTLGGSPPKEALRRSRAALQRHVSERLKAQRDSRKEMARLVEPFRELLFSHIPRDDSKLKMSIRANKSAYEQRVKRKNRPPKSEKFEARVVLGSIQAIKVPPYDDSWSFQSARSDASTYADGGFFGFAASSIHFDASVPFFVFGSL